MRLRYRVALIGVAAVVLVLVIAQLVLPGVAAQSLRDRLSKSGHVIDVEVSAFPAIELLWHQADRVVVRMDQYRSNTGHLSSLLDEAGDVGSLDASANTLSAGLLTLRDATLRKRGDQLSGTARVSEDDLRASLPILQSVQPVASGGGQLTLRGTATLLGVTASIDATVRALEGELVVQPDVPFGGFATISVFHDPHLLVQGVSAAGAPGGFSVSAQGTLR
jgi:hypothetical protein